MISLSKGTFLAASTVAAATFGSGAALAENKDLKTAGDILQFALPAAGYAGTFLADDPEGRLQLTKSLLTATAITQSLKFGFDKTRPNGSTGNSFPSGHTQGAFSGASFIATRYGPLYGVPAYALAALTGYSRVNADAHFVDDVVAGASIAMMANFAFTNPLHDGVVVYPLASKDAVGLQVSLLNAIENKDKVPGYSQDDTSNVRFELQLGPAFVGRNEIKAPSSGGTKFDLADFAKNDDPTTTAWVTLEYAFNKHHSIYGSFAPFESRDTNVFTDDVVFDDEIFTAGTAVRSAYRNYDGRAGYEYSFFPTEHAFVDLGAGFQVQYVSMELEAADGSQYQEVSAFTFLPLLNARIGYEVFDSVVVFAEGFGMTLGEDWLAEVGAGVSYRFNENWDAKLSYYHSERAFETSDLENRVSYDGIFLAVGYTF